MKVDVSLMGNKLNVAKLHQYLQRSPSSKGKYKLQLIQELGAPSNVGPNKGKPSPYGFCWLNNVDVKDLAKFGPGLWTWGAEKIAIDVYQGDIECQTCWTLGHDLISVAARMNAYIEIIDFIPKHRRKKNSKTNKVEK